MISLLVALLLGMFAGVLTGLLPGVHTNTIAMLVLGMMPQLSKIFTPLEISIFLVCMVVVHSFVDFIPSIFFGAPEAETVLSVLPGHKLLNIGLGYEALKLTVVGGILAFISSLIFLPIFIVIIRYVWFGIKQSIAPILLTLSLLFVLKEGTIIRMVWALIIFLLSGVLGLLALNHLNLSQPLFPLLTGFFGLSTLALSLYSNQKVPQQKISENIFFFSKRNILNAIKSVFSASITSTLPGIGAAQAAVIARGFVKYKHPKEWLVVVGGINTAASVLTLSVFYVLGKARTGVLVVVKEIIKIGTTNYLILLVSTFVAVGFAVACTLSIGKIFAKNIHKIPYSILSFLIILFVCGLIIKFSGMIGLFVASVATAIGILAPIVGVRRIHAMACLIVPVALYFL